MRTRSADNVCTDRNDGKKIGYHLQEIEIIIKITLRPYRNADQNALLTSMQAFVLTADGNKSSR